VVGVWRESEAQIKGIIHMKTPHLVACIKRRLTLSEWIKQEWLRKFLKVSQKVEEKWECPDCDAWKTQRMIQES
jgi:hypothetical protein